MGNPCSRSAAGASHCHCHRLPVTSEVTVPGGKVVSHLHSSCRYRAAKPSQTAPQVSICSDVFPLNRHSPRPRSTSDFACSGPCSSPIIHLFIVVLGIGFATSYWWRPCQRTDNDSPLARRRPRVHRRAPHWVSCHCPRRPRPLLCTPRRELTQLTRQREASLHFTSSL